MQWDTNSLCEYVCKEKQPFEFGFGFVGPEFTGVRVSPVPLEVAPGVAHLHEPQPTALVRREYRVGVTWNDPSARDSCFLNRYESTHTLTFEGHTTNHSGSEAIPGMSPCLRFMPLGVDVLTICLAVVSSTRMVQASSSGRLDQSLGL